MVMRNPEARADPRTTLIFLVLPAGSPLEPERACCGQAWRAWRRGRQVGLHAGSREQARRLDTLLWSFNDLSFLPHRLADAAGPAAQPAPPREAIISWGDQAPPTCEVLFNLAAFLPETDPAQKIVEIVPGREPRRSQARERCRHYKSQGLQLLFRDLPPDDQA